MKFHDDPAKNDSKARLGAMVTQLDAKVGEFVAALERTGQRENTLIVFTSDNGGLKSGGNGYVSKVPGSPFNSDNTPLRGEKATLYEGGIRVDAFVNWPAKLKPCKMTAPMHAVDWFPTIANLVGYKPAEELEWDGVNMWPAITGEVTKPAPRTIYVRFTRGMALRDGDWKLVVSKDGKAELFNLALDPYEQNDLAKAEPERVAAMRAKAQEIGKNDPKEMPEDLKGVHG